MQTALTAGAPMVLGDFARLNQVLWNLLKNAVKFSPIHGRITVSTANDSGSVVVEVRDHGIGIEPEQLAIIFGDFSRGNSQAPATGFGLGLAIARAIVEGHGGEIRAASEGKDCGATFRITLPGTEATEPPGEAAPPSSTSGEMRGKTIMVVEDH